jgi:hypothetical protein
MISLTIYLPGGAARTGAFVLAVLLGVWGIWHDVREARRAKLTTRDLPDR